LDTPSYLLHTVLSFCIYSAHETCVHSAIISTVLSSHKNHATNTLSYDHNYGFEVISSVYDLILDIDHVPYVSVSISLSFTLTLETSLPM